MSGQVPKAVVQERYERLVELQDDISWAESRAQVGRRLELMVAEGEGRKDGSTSRLSGRAPDNRLVHFAPPANTVVRPGDVVEVEVTYAAPHHLVSDAPVLAVRRTRSGDAWEARTRAPATSATVGLGMPTVGAPAPTPA
jgi:tRNA-2-methylthio-N6-dimethylallyladenosine synthase